MAVMWKSKHYIQKIQKIRKGLQKLCKKATQESR